MEDRKPRTNFFNLVEEARDRGLRSLTTTLDSLSRKLQTRVKVEDGKHLSPSIPTTLSKEQSQSLEKQLKTWKENPSWIDEPPKIKVNVPKGSLCNLSVECKVGLPPDAIFNIVTDPGNQRVFKNIKEVIYRKVLVDEGFRQVVEVEQAALWRFLWWSGTLSVHVYVDQNREKYTVSFKQGKSGFMKRFEGCWSLQPLFVDEDLCSRERPQSLMDYETCSGGKGRVGTFVKLEQLVQPSVVPPPPISWYLRGITTNTTQVMMTDLQAEAARVREGGDQNPIQEDVKVDKLQGDIHHHYDPIKERWHNRRRRRTCSK